MIRMIVVGVIGILTREFHGKPKLPGCLGTGLPVDGEVKNSRYGSQNSEAFSEKILFLRAAGSMVKVEEDTVGNHCGGNYIRDASGLQLRIWAVAAIHHEALVNNFMPGSVDNFLS
jgi:hypothetical protein